MGLTIELCDEHGDPQADAIQDVSNILHPLLRAADSATSPMLAGIDWYGDTVFNGQQMERFIPEWQSLATLAKAKAELDIVAGVLGLARQCQDGIHLYLKFVGE